MVHQLYFSQKIFVCSYDNGAYYLYPKLGPFIYIFSNMCMREVKSHICGGLNPSRLAFAIKIINSCAGSHDRSDIITTNHIMHFSK